MNIRSTGAVVAAVALMSAATTASALELKMNGLHPPDHPLAATHEYFAERVGQLTDGEITVDVHHARALGDAVESVQSIRNGTIAFFSVSASNLSQVIPRMDMFSLPYLFKTAGHYWWYLNSQRAMDFVAPLEEKGIKVLGWMDSGARNFFSKEPIRSVEDLEGRKIRVMASPVQVATIGAMGGTGVPVAWGELYNALQTGLVDGAENNNPSILSMKFYEVSNYYTLDEHARIPDLLIMSKKVFDSLPPDQQAVVEQAGLLAQAYMRGAWAAHSTLALEQLQSKFEEIIEVDKGPFIEAVKPLLAEEGERLGVTDEINYLLESGDNF